jgi:hypothetical protein
VVGVEPPKEVLVRLASPCVLHSENTRDRLDDIAWP